MINANQELEINVWIKETLSSNWVRDLIASCRLLGHPSLRVRY